MSGALIFASTAKGRPLDCLALEDRVDCILGPMANWRRTVLGRLPPPGHCTDSRLIHFPSLCAGSVYAGSGALV